MATRNRAYLALALIFFADLAMAQTKMNLPGCGPEQEVVYKEGLAVRETAYEAAKAANSALRNELRVMTDSYSALGCAGTPTGGDTCAALESSIEATRDIIAENGKYTTALAAAAYAYRTQQPFVTPAGEACLRCKSPGDFSCVEPGLTPGFKPPGMPKHPDRPDPPSLCSNLSGSWHHETEGVGASTWHLKGTKGSLEAIESGMGNARGTATFSGNVLRITFATTIGIDGYYEWTLDAHCRSGQGKVVFTKGRSGSYPSKVNRTGAPSTTARPEAKGSR